MEERGPTTQLRRKSCTLCSRHHVACEGKQPCRRCVEWGKAPQCEFLLSRKRGPQKQAKPSAGERVTTKRKKLRTTTDADVAPTQALDEGRLAGTKSQVTFPTIGKSSVAPMTLAQTMAVSRAQTSEMAAGQVTTLPTTLLSLLIEQVRGLRKENHLLVERMMSLQNQQTVFERQMDAVRSDQKSSTAWLMDQLAALEASRTMQVRMQPDLLMQPIEPGSGMHLSAIKHILPFLAAYDLTATELVVNDLRKPFSANSVHKDGRGIRMNYTYVSPAYIELVGYDSSELLGAPVALVCDPSDHESRDIVLYQLDEPCPRLRVGPIFSTRATAITRDRRVVRTSSRHQFFYDIAGNCRWCLTSIDHVLSRGEESPLYIDTQEIQQRGGHSDHDESKSVLTTAPSHCTALTWSASASGSGGNRLDHDLDELLHVLSPPSPCPL